MLALQVDPSYGAGETESSKALEEDLKDRAAQSQLNYSDWLKHDTDPWKRFPVSAGKRVFAVRRSRMLKCSAASLIVAGHF